MITTISKPQKISKITQEPKKFAKDFIIDFIKRSLKGKGEAHLSFQEICSATGYSLASVKRTIRHMRKLNAVWHIESGTGQKNGNIKTLFKRL